MLGCSIVCKDVCMRVCEECDGDGYLEVGPQCMKPASECCGGCYVKVECEECNGKGETEHEEL